MKKQTEILTKSLAQPPARRKDWILLAVFATLIYRNPFNRISPSGISPNGVNTIKRLFSEIVAGLEKLVNLAGNFFYNNSESNFSVFQFVSITGLIIALIAAVM